MTALRRAATVGVCLLLAAGAALDTSPAHARDDGSVGITVEIEERPAPQPAPAPDEPAAPRDDDTLPETGVDLGLALGLGALLLGGGGVARVWATGARHTRVGSGR